MKSSQGNVIFAVYELGVGALLVVHGVVTRSWWSAAVGVLLFAYGAAMAFGRGEGTSWVRGDLDERRNQVVDRAFRTAFIVLAYWIAGCAIATEATTAPLSVAWWTAGIVIALVAAHADYAVRIRRT